MVSSTGTEGAGASWPSGLAEGKEELSRLGEQILQAQQYSEEQNLQHAEKKGVTDNAVLFARQSLKQMAECLVTAADASEQRVAEQHALVSSLEAQAAMVAQHAKMQKLGERHGRAQATATQQAFVRSEKTFDTV